MTTSQTGDLNTTAKRVQYVMNKEDLQPEDVQEICQVRSLSTVYRWMNNDSRPYPKYLGLLAEATGYRYEWLLSGAGPDKPIRSEVEEIDMTVGAGSDGGVIIDQRPIARYEIDYVPLPDIPDRRPSNPFLTRIIGESMESEFSSGDRVVVEPYPKGERHIKADAIYVFRVDQEVQIKQLEYKPGYQLVCKPINQRYDAFTLDLTDEGLDFEIIGRVWGKFKRY